MNEVAQEIEALRRLPMDDLVAKYREVYGREPRVRHREFLWKRIAWKLQEVRFGGLSKVAQARLEELISEIKLPIAEQQRTITGKLRGARRPDDPPVGTVLVKQWRGREVRVTVLEDGYEVEGVVHRTLSAAATAITGQHWNGRLFFGLVNRRRVQ